MAYLDELLAQDESVRLISRRHILFLVVHTALYVLGAIALWILAVIAYRSLSDPANLIVTLLLLAFSIVPVAIAIYRFLSWKLEQYIITSYRILQVEGIINKRTFDSALEKVNDVMMTQGLFGRLFGYGDIEVITGTEIGVNQLHGIAEPFAFKRALLESKLQLEGPDQVRRPTEQAVARAEFAAMPPANDAARLLAALVDLRDSGVISADEYEARKNQLLQQG